MNTARRQSEPDVGQDGAPPGRGPLVWLAAVEGRVAMMLRPYGLTLLRTSLGLVFVWFGALKVAHDTPVAELVAGAVPWLDASWFVPLLGVVEVVLGVALVVGRWLTIVAGALAAHLSGTFLVLVMEPYVAFQHGNPMLLTTAGEFVVKNLVLVSAALVLASRLGDPHVRVPPGCLLTRHDSETAPNPLHNFVPEEKHGDR